MTIKRSSTRCQIGMMNEAQLLKRCDIWTVVGGKDYAGKPRPEAGPWLPYRFPCGRLRSLQAYVSAVIFVLLPGRKSQQNHLLRHDSLVFSLRAEQQMHARILAIRDLQCSHAAFAG